MNEPYIIKAGDFDPETMERQVFGAETSEWTSCAVHVGRHSFANDKPIVVRDKPKPPEPRYLAVEPAKGLLTDLHPGWPPIESYDLEEPVCVYEYEADGNFRRLSSEEVEALKAAQS